MHLAPLQAGPPAPALPRLTTTVPKEYVHRACHAEVFLTGCTKHSETQFTLLGQWPRAHTFFQSADGTRHDPLLTAETFRQAGLLLAHAELGVPLGHHFVMWELGFSTQADRLDIGPQPTDIHLTATCTDITRRGTRATGFRMELTIHRHGQAIAAGGGRFTVIPPAVYHRLRTTRLTRDVSALREIPRRPLPPATVGRARTADVVLSPADAPHRWLLTPDPTHPVLYDHTGDHHPGMVLLEAARQASSALLAPLTVVPTAISTAFHRYAELDHPCIVEAALAASQEHHHVTVEVTGRQDGKTVFTSLLTTQPT
ncbi:ScbA/BarX family gamma-butyrolactone biosynthesis protein [Streptomyces sp. NRRL S-646]|uniref:ScbA/BarX family gamma-butyrolactone biosynthesis protein n=1 Tax=Streptomyces sp. NRRL S-646 TaxID=1463917 RepID=UPI0004CC563A|nr:ScbA/BarX family gamma-butyrolactone biosynthesis protein [Streptomyces sp. NRRL S-646]